MVSLPELILYFTVPAGQKINGHNYAKPFFIFGELCQFLRAYSFPCLTKLYGCHGKFKGIFETRDFVAWVI